MGGGWGLGVWTRGRGGAPGTVHPLSGPPFSEALCSLLWVGVPRPWGVSRRTGLGGHHTGPWAPDETAWSLSPLSLAGRPPQGQCVGPGLGFCRRTDYKGWGGHFRMCVLGEPQPRPPGGGYGTSKAAGLKGKPWPPSPGERLPSGLQAVSIVDGWAQPVTLWALADGPSILSS